MEKILIVEDSKVISSYLQKKLNDSISDVSIVVTDTMSKLKKLFDENKNFSIALVDINLPDVHDLSLIEFLLENNIPTLVMTASFNDEQYKKLKSSKIMDFVLKDSISSLDYLVSLTKRILNNKNKTVLVVDDSTTSLKHTQNYLRGYLYNVVIEQDSTKVVDIVKSSNIDIVVVDYYMPDINGTELIQRLRKHFTKDELVIIGISSDEKSAIHFLKYGANDFIKKPFEKEEFLHRVNNLAQHLDNIEYLKNIVNTDHLTKIYNRKYFFEEGEKYLKHIKDDEQFCIAMIDIDNFKSVNDTYGHDIGDLAIKQVANILKGFTKGSDIVARIGGEEFAVILKNITFEDAFSVFEKIRKSVEKTKIDLDSKNSINITVSIGLSFNECEERSLTKLLKLADNRLYLAKNSGKNKIIYKNEKELELV